MQSCMYNQNIVETIKNQTNVMIFKIVCKFRVVYHFDNSSKSSQLPDGNKKNHDVESISKSYYEIW